MNTDLKSMACRVIALAAVIGSFTVFGVISGCTFDAQHNRAHWESFKGDVRDSHQFIDRTFFNYDWDDPENWYIER